MAWTLAGHKHGNFSIIICHPTCWEHVKKPVYVQTYPERRSLQCFFPFMLCLLEKCGAVWGHAVTPHCRVIGKPPTSYWYFQTRLNTCCAVGVTWSFVLQEKISSGVLASDVRCWWVVSMRGCYQAYLESSHLLICMNINVGPVQTGESQCS